MLSPGRPPWTSPRRWVLPFRACAGASVLLSVLVAPSIAAAEPSAPRPARTSPPGTNDAAANEPGTNAPPPNTPPPTQAADAPPPEAEEEDIVVSGFRPHPSQPLRERSVSGSVLRGERLLQPGAAPADVLREAPGVQVTQVGGLGAPATASLRGATAAQTPVYLGGVRLNDEVGGAANLADLPLFLIDRIEVYRSHGPADLEMGVGGALLFEPRRPRSFEISLGAQAGSFGTRGGHGYVQLGNERRGALAAFELSAADNDYTYADDRGTLFEPGDDRTRRLQNADAQLGRFWLIAEERLGSANVRFLLHHARRDQGAPKLALTPTRAARVAHERDLFAVTSRVPIERWGGSLELVTAATSSATWLSDPLAELNLTSPEIHTPGEHLEQRLRAVQRLDSGLTLSQQLSVSTERLRRFERAGGAPVQLLAARRISLRPSLSAEQELGGGVSVRGTAALRCFDTSTAELSTCSELLPEGRLGASQRGERHEIYVNVGRYQRLPTLSELYGTSLLVRGNSRLEVERGSTLEVGGRYQVLRRGQSPLLWLDGAAFARWSTDLILYVRTAQGYLIPENRAASRTLGAEFGGGLAPLGGLEISGHVSLLDARDTSPGRTLGNDVLPFISPATLAALAAYTLSFDESAFDEATFGVRVTHQSSRFADPAGLGVIPAQTQTDLELAARLFERHVTLRGRLANLFDARRFDVVGFPLPGRSAFLTMETTW